MIEYDKFIDILVNDSPVDEFLDLIEELGAMPIEKRMEFVDSMSTDNRFSTSLVYDYIKTFEANEILMRCQKEGVEAAQVEISDMDRLKNQAEAMENIVIDLNDNITMSPVRFSSQLTRFTFMVVSAKFIIQMYTGLLATLENDPFEED